MKCNKLTSTNVRVSAHAGDQFDHSMQVIGRVEFAVDGARHEVAQFAQFGQL